MMIKTPTQGSIPRRSTHCFAKGEPLQPSSEYVSCLLIEDETWKRYDYCLACWQATEKQRREDKGSFWKGKVPTKKETILRKDEKTLELFRSMVTDYAPTKQKLLMVLTLYLERKKQMVRRVELKEELSPNIHFYELLETGEVFSIEYCSLSQEDSEKMIEELKARLK